MLERSVITVSNNGMETGRKFTCNIFYYILGYTKICFFVFILPFYAYIEDGTLKLKHFLLHQLICLIFNILAIYFGCTTLWGLMHESTFSQSSITIYEFATFSLLNTGVIVFIFTTWCKKPNPCENLLNHTFNYVDAMARPKYPTFVVFIAIALHLAITGYPELSAHFTKSSIAIKIEAKELFILVMAIYFQLLFQLAVIVPFYFVGLCMFLIGKRFKELAMIEYSVLDSPALKWNPRSVQLLTDYYMSVKSLTDELNKAFGKIMIVVFLSVLPTLGHGLAVIILKQDTGSFVDHMRTIYILVVFYVFVLLAANGASKVQNYTQIIFEQLWNSKSLNTIDGAALMNITQYVNSSPVGVGGTPFFLFTYKVVGSTTSLLITYTIIMLQFRA